MSKETITIRANGRTVNLPATPPRPALPFLLRVVRWVVVVLRWVIG